MVVAWRARLPARRPSSAHARVPPSPRSSRRRCSRTPRFGPAAPDGLRVAGDRAGNFAIAFLQGPPGGLRLVVAVYDREPGMPTGTTSTNYQRRRKPTLRWRAAQELWGPQTFRVLVDGTEVGRTQDFKLRVPVSLADGSHKWQRGRRRPPWPGASGPRADACASIRRRPRLSVRLTGKRARGEVLKLTIRARDTRGSGVKYVSTDFGDKTRTTTLRKVLHRYSRSGRFALNVKAVDKAGNVARRTIRVRIKK